MRYTDERTGKYDGVHLYGRDGQMVYTESVINILLSSLNTQAQFNQESANHTSCPQTVFKKKNMKKNQQGKYNVKVSNRFSTLNKVQGNF